MSTAFSIVIYSSLYTISSLSFAKLFYNIAALEISLIYTCFAFRKAYLFQYHKTFLFAHNLTSKVSAIINKRLNSIYVYAILLCNILYVHNLLSGLGFTISGKTKFPKRNVALCIGRYTGTVLEIFSLQRET